MKILVTGGAGFIGSHIVDAHVKAGHKVSIVDDLSTGFRKNVNPKAGFYKADIRNLSVIKKIFRKEKPEIVNHHAAVALIMQSLADQTATYETNLVGTANLLILFGEYGKNPAGAKKKFIFSSTGGAIYGEPKKIPADEDNPVVPLSPYGLSKFLGEEIIKFYAKYYGLDYLIFRYPNVYGPRDISHVIPLFTKLMKAGNRPTIFGDGTKARDYTYVSDVVRANMLALRRGRNQIVNLGWGKPTSDQMIFDAIAKELDFKDGPIYAPYRKGEVYRIALDARKAKKILGWKPKIELEEGIRKTLAGL